MTINWSGSLPQRISILRKIFIWPILYWYQIQGVILHMKMLNGFAQGCILFFFPFPSYSNLAQLLRELLQPGPDEDVEDHCWQGSQPAADWSGCGHRKFSLKNKVMSSNALRSMRTLWLSLLRNSDLSPTRFDEEVFVKVKVMELKSKSHNFVSIPRTNSGSS